MVKEPDFVVVLITASSAAEANIIAGALVRERLAPCVSVAPEVLSTYWWEGDVQSAKESLLIVKTKLDVFEALKDRVLELHSYDVPEIVCMPLVKGSENYLSWMMDYFK